MQQGLLYFLALAVGVGISLQVGMNITLRGVLMSPMVAALVSFLVGSLALLLFVLATGAPWPARGQVHLVPLWAWFGGVMGALYVASSIILGPRLGAAALLALVVLGQLVTSLVLDHFGWLGFAQHPLSVTRTLGAVFLFCGVLLIVR
ncbi:MAG TPA: DMT family transporter [Steroidobacteraceae bacterium]|jgi:transporter family-2 protein